MSTYRIKISQTYNFPFMFIADAFGGTNQVGGGGPAPGGLSWYPNNYPWPIEEVQ